MVILSSASLSSAEEMKNMQGKEPAMKQDMMMSGKMMEGCKEMMAEKKKMMEEMKAQDVQLTEQVAQMNSAPNDQKINLMAAVITRVVEQRTAMNMQMEKMHGKMMKHMMQHMQMGKESMAQCSMMKDAE